MSESRGFSKFQHTLTSDKQMLSIWFFYRGFMLEILQQTKTLSMAQFKNQNFEFKSWKKKKGPWKIFSLFFKF